MTEQHFILGIFHFGFNVNSLCWTLENNLAAQIFDFNPECAWDPINEGLIVVGLTRF